MKNLWNRTFGKLYYNAFKRHFETTINRLTKLVYDFHSIDKRLAELDAHVHALTEAGWQEKALARRIAAMEDRLNVLTDQVAAHESDGTAV
jgi:hypothetical protein